MTAIAGLVHAGRVHLASDSAVLSNWKITVSAQPKVVRRGPYVFGLSGDLRTWNVVCHADYKLPDPAGRDAFELVTTTVVDALREALQAAGVAEKTNEKEDANGSLLIGVAGRLFEMSPDYAVSESARGYAAIGCGADLCLGSLHATRRRVDPRLRLLDAVHAAAEHNIGVCGPFHQVSTT